MKFQNTEAIYETIGNYPVTDQFDVLYSNLMSGSIYDRYITGSFLISTANINGLGVTYSQGPRAKVFNKLLVSSTQAGATLKTDRNRSYNLQPYRERAGIIRNLKIFSNSERFYDSLMPKISELVTTAGGSIGKSVDGSYATLMLKSIPSTWERPLLMSFPFEPKFSTVKRIARISTGYITSQDNKPSNNLIISYGFPTLEGRAEPRPIIAYNNGGAAYVKGALEQDIAKILFGFGASSTGSVGKEMPYIASNVVYGWTNAVEFRSGSVYTDDDTVACLIGPKIRGWKYGVIDGNPHYTSAIFRRDSFGQLRDMLEQRKDSCTISDEVNSPINYLGSFESPAMPKVANSIAKVTAMPKISAISKGYGSAGMSAISAATMAVKAPALGTIIPSYPIIVKFVSLQETVNPPALNYIKVLPNDTLSSNLSMYATSSMPYFDDICKNRSVTIGPDGIPRQTDPNKNIFITSIL